MMPGRSRSSRAVLAAFAAIGGLFALDFHLDTRERDVFSWMDPYQYLGSAGTGILLSLPGPNDEVELGIDAALGLLTERAAPAEIAVAVAGVLRERLSEKMRSCSDPNSLRDSGWRGDRL